MFTSLRQHQCTQTILFLHSVSSMCCTHPSLSFSMHSARWHLRHDLARLFCCLPRLNVFIPIVRCRRRRRRRLAFDTNCLNTSRVDLMLLLFHFDRCGDYTFFVRRYIMESAAAQPAAAGACSPIACHAVGKLK